METTVYKEIDQGKIRSNESKNIGLCFSGGGLRAIAFQLGCLKALNERSLLGRVKVISAVSGGAILACMYAYGSGSFEEFESEVIYLLRKGLAGSLIRSIFFPFRTMLLIFTWMISGLSALLAEITRAVITFITRHTRETDYNHTPAFIFNIRPPFRRWFSRTSALEHILENMIFRNKKMSDARRNNVEVILSSTELLTSKSFRFGSRRSGCDCLGDIKDNNINVAHAVAASSAHPVFFPAIDTLYPFEGTDGKVEHKRVLLSDGGIIDNLGVTSMLYESLAGDDYIVSKVDYVICCTAIQGHKRSIPYWLIPRIIRVSETINRKLLAFEQENLKRSVKSGAIEGFLLLCLSNGCNEKIQNYPTNFFAMKQSDINAIVSRGKQMTEEYLEKYYVKIS